MKSLALNAYAKINLYLRVLRKREDGYHDIETLFERITLHDKITLSPADDGEIHLDCLRSHLSAGPENLCYRAAEQFRKKFGIQKGIRIHLTKKIPIAAGLGGGSSDAAAVLSGLNQWWSVGASQQDLLELGGQMGADVPFFLLGVRRAIGKGRGDVFTGAGLKPAPARTFYLIATPQISVLTKDVYESWDKLNGLTPLAKSATINDLEPVVLQSYPQVREFAEHLKRLGLVAIRLSGSGPTFFTQLKNRESAEGWAQRIKETWPRSQVFCVEGC